MNFNPSPAPSHGSTFYYQYPQQPVTRKTTVTREYDDKGRVVKETTVTEYGSTSIPTVWYGPHSS